jgi:Domain of unknown function (DUF1906)
VGLLALLVTLLAFVGSAQAHSPSKVVRYRGFKFRVPSSWPVFGLGARPDVCVRFDRHAVYLGRPSGQQRCPTAAAGRTEAILVEPSSARRLPSVLPGAQDAAAEIAVPKHRVVVLGTWANDPGVIAQAMGMRSLRALRAHSVKASTAAAHASRARATVAGIYTGLGFDACSAPSAATMSAWASSPYHAVGIYIGGANVACSQPNLSAAWVSQESTAGWHLIPTYVGLQAAGSGCGCATINKANASSQGSAAATDAVNQASALGIGPGNPIYYDMEGYSATAANNSAVLAFLSGWTGQLHALGYTSGVYSSADSGIRALVAAEGTSFVEPDDIWIADWNNAKNTNDPNVPGGDWANHQRIHQYAGGHNATYGGDTLNIDSNYLDGATAGANGGLSLFPDGTFVQVAGTWGVYEIAGGAPLVVSSWSAVGGPQPVTVITQQQFNSLRRVPLNGTFLATSAGTAYRVAGGAPIQITNWNVFGGVQPFVTIDPWDIQNITNPAAHLRRTPSSGTTVEGVPSRNYWYFNRRGRRMIAGTNRSATAVDDRGLIAFPAVPCVAPRLTNLSFPQAKSALAKADCRLGKVGRPLHWPRFHKLRVFWQIPIGGRRHTAGWRVGIKMR